MAENEFTIPDPVVQGDVIVIRGVSYRFGETSTRSFNTLVEYVAETGENPFPSENSISIYILDSPVHNLLNVEDVWKAVLKAQGKS